METLIQLDQQLLLFLNGLNTPFWDDIMFAISGKLIWVPLYAILLTYVIVVHKKKALLVVIAIALAVGLSDFTASKVFKPNVKRPRPSHEITIQKDVHIVNNYKGGEYGFFSSHAATTFSLAFFFVFMYKKRKRIFYTLPLWALIVSYSRIYLGVHYPLDILCGMLCGTLYSYLAYKLLYITKFLKYP